MFHSMVIMKYNRGADGTTKQTVLNSAEVVRKPYTKLSVLNNISRGVYLDFFVLFVFFTVYSVFWSILTIAKLDALNASIYDLGNSMQSLWYVTNGIHSVKALESTLSAQAILFILAPLYYVLSPQLLLVIQSVSLGSIIFPIYGISRAKLNNRLLSIVIASLSLVYFPMAGPNWFDFHFYTLFIPLFLWGYYAYVGRHFGVACALMILSGTVVYPFNVFPLLFSVIGLSEVVFRRKDSANKKSRAELMALLIIFVSMFLLSIAQYVFLGTSQIVTQATGGVSQTFNEITIWNGSKVLFYLLFPMAFLPLLSKRWILFFVPYAIMIFMYSSWGTTFPNIFQIQFNDLIIPFLWISFIEAMESIDKRFRGIQNRRNNVSPVIYLKKNRLSILPKLAVISVAVLIIGSALFFEPWGPFNSTSAINFNTRAETDVNYSQLETLYILAALIPSGEKNIIVQNNLPQALVGHLGPHFVSSVDVLPFNQVNITNNEFPYLYGGSIKIDYVLADKNNYWYNMGNPTFGQECNELLSSGYYEMVAGAYGLFLLARDSEHAGHYNITISDVILSHASDSGKTWNSSVVFNVQMSAKMGDNITRSNSIDGPHFLEMIPTNDNSINSLLILGNVEYEMQGRNF